MKREDRLGEMLFWHLGKPGTTPWKWGNEGGEKGKNVANVAVEVKKLVQRGEDVFEKKKDN